MTTCRKGHPKNTRNGYLRSGAWVCRVCKRLAQRERYQADFRSTEAYQHRVLSKA